MRRTAKRALHAQLVCQRCATKSRSFQSDFVFVMQLATGRTTLLMPISRRCCPFVGACIHLHSLEDHGVLYASLLKSCLCGLDHKHFGCSLRLPCTAILDIFFFGSFFGEPESHSFRNWSAINWMTIPNLAAAGGFGFESTNLLSKIKIDQAGLFKGKQGFNQP